MRLLAMFSVFLMLSPAGEAGERPATDDPSLETILEHMKAHEQWQRQHLLEYSVQRTFHAANPRFNLESTLEVRTSFHKPDSFNSEIVRSAGSKIIRERVFDKILQAEDEARTKESNRSAITPENYNFKWIGQEDCDGRSCYRLRISSKRKDKFNIDGEIWIDAEEGAIRRIHGVPARRPSIWTLHTEIDRRYKRINGFWLFDSMESDSNVLIGGESKLRIDHSYVSVVGDVAAAKTS